MIDEFDEASVDPAWAPAGWITSWDGSQSSAWESVTHQYVKGSAIFTAPIASSASTTQTTAVKEMFLAKPLRLVYEEHGNRYHLTAGEPTELPLKVSMQVQEIYSMHQGGWESWGNEPKVTKEVEITLKFRVKTYQIKKIETE